MISIITNNFNRLLTKKSLIYAMLILTSCAILAAVFFSTKSETVGNIAYLAENNQTIPDIPGLKVTVLTEKPGLSQLASGRYDAIITQTADGSYKAESIKSQETNDKILGLLNGTIHINDLAGEKRGTGATIMGFLLMFLLMEGSMLMCMFAEDKEQHQLTRISASPLSVTKYMMAHSIFNFSFLVIPTMSILYIVKAILGVNIGFNFGQYLLLISLISAFATAFSLLLNAFANKSDTANMSGSTIIVLTSVLAGSFYSFDKGNAVLEKLIRILPQKAYLTFTENLEQGGLRILTSPHFLYLILLILVFFGIAVYKTHRDYIANV